MSNFITKGIETFVTLGIKNLDNLMTLFVYFSKLRNKDVWQPKQITCYFIQVLFNKLGNEINFSIISKLYVWIELNKWKTIFHVLFRITNMSWNNLKCKYNINIFQWYLLNNLDMFKSFSEKCFQIKSVLKVRHINF